MSRDNHHKDKIIKKLEGTISLQENTIGEIERELQEVNRFYSQKPEIITEVMDMLQVQNEN
jgi:uncharacterized coiled-coil protein SlyX